MLGSRGLPRVISSPGPIKFDQASAEASSFLNQENRDNTPAQNERAMETPNTNNDPLKDALRLNRLPSSMMEDRDLQTTG